jgi:hypothetical protein
VTELTDHSGDPDFAPDQGVLERISGFGEDDAGNLYILKLGTPSGFSVLATPASELRMIGLGDRV